jgi:hypothetical protein
LKMESHLQTTLETLDEDRYPLPKTCCRIKKEAILEKRRLYIQRLNESKPDNSPTKEG